MRISGEEIIMMTELKNKSRRLGFYILLGIICVASLMSLFEWRKCCNISSGRKFLYDKLVLEEEEKVLKEMLRTDVKDKLIRAFDEKSRASRLIKALLISLLWVVTVFLDGDWWVCCKNNHVSCNGTNTTATEEKEMIAELKNTSKTNGFIILLVIVFLAALMSCCPWRKCCYGKKCLYDKLILEEEKIVLKEILRTAAKEKLNDAFIVKIGDKNWEDCYKVADELMKSDKPALSEKQKQQFDKLRAAATGESTAGESATGATVGATSRSNSDQPQMPPATTSSSNTSYGDIPMAADDSGKLCYSEALFISGLWVVTVFIDGDWWVCCKNDQSEQQAQLSCKDTNNITTKEKEMIAKLKNTSKTNGFIILLVIVFLAALMSCCPWRKCCYSKKCLYDKLILEEEKIVLTEILRTAAKEKLNDAFIVKIGDKNWEDCYKVADELMKSDKPALSEKQKQEFDKLRAAATGESTAGESTAGESATGATVGATSRSNRSDQDDQQPQTSSDRTSRSQTSAGESLELLTRDFTKWLSANQNRLHQTLGQ
ncbi:hypothetical protein Q8A73_014546 [Channa argus]|nr:hypothetical protein Q8A73_014546 [Channa argus]